MIRVLMVATEAGDYAKVGGLADVMAALPAALRRKGYEVSVFLPRYRRIRLDGTDTVWTGTVLDRRVSIHRLPGEVPIYFLDCPELYDRNGIHGEGAEYPDNHLRYATLSRSTLALARDVLQPDIIHCHDFQTGLVPVYLRQPEFATDPVLGRTKSVFTIHNLGYQGLYPRESLALMHLPEDLFKADNLEFYGRVNMMKGAIVFSDLVTTVSPTYAREITSGPEFSMGLEGVLRSRPGGIVGVLNGVDYTWWNPETDFHLAARFSREDLVGKQDCKLDLLERMGLETAAPHRPVIGLIGRLVDQKGFDLVHAATSELLAEDVALVVLGSGDAKYEMGLRGAAADHRTRVAFSSRFDEALAHQIEAGADMFLMPSKYEPCGLNQMYSLRYGTLPIVRATGGLADTVDADVGFQFSEYTPSALMACVREALSVYRDADRWKRMIRRAMERDNSWDSTAATYSKLYQDLVV